MLDNQWFPALAPPSSDAMRDVGSTDELTVGVIDFPRATVPACPSAYGDRCQLCRCRLADAGHPLEQDQMGIAMAPAARPSARSPSRLDLEPLLKDDGGTRGRAPVQGPQEIPGPDQAALVDLVMRIPWQELNPSPEAGLVVAPGPGRVPGIVDALAADVAALDDASAAFLHHFPYQAVLERFARLDPTAGQVPVPLATDIAAAQDDHPGPGEAHAVDLAGVRRFRPERGIEPGEGHPAAPVGDLLDRPRPGFGQTSRVAVRRHDPLHRL